MAIIMGDYLYAQAMSILVANKFDVAMGILARVVTPTKLTARQKELLEEFAREGGEEIHPLGKGFFDKVKELFE